eukprot:COSAG06_NODE_4581_length_4128_cov_3.717300_4_plen_184_part_00
MSALPPGRPSDSCMVPASRCLSKNGRGCCIGHGRRARARCQRHRGGCVTKMRLCWGVCVSSWRSLILLALLLSALAPAVAVAELSCPTALVLLRHPPAGLRWLERRWAAATDPLSVEYRRFSAAAEIMSHLSPPPTEVQLRRAGWRPTDGASASDTVTPYVLRDRVRPAATAPGIQLGSWIYQ